MKTKQQIPEVLRKQLSAAGKKGWKAKIAKAEKRIIEESKKVVATEANKIGK